jgi:hypothetical protein
MAVRTLTMADIEIDKPYENSSGWRFTVVEKLEDQNLLVVEYVDTAHECDGNYMVPEAVMEIETPELPAWITDKQVVSRRQAMQARVEAAESKAKTDGVIANTTAINYPYRYGCVEQHANAMADDLDRVDLATRRLIQWLADCGVEAPSSIIDLENAIKDSRKRLGVPLEVKN